MAHVRLRSRSRRSSESGLRPQRPSDAWTETWTTVGNLDSGVRGLVEPAGRIAVDGWGWSLDWWIGAEDRWHRPAAEAAVRQQLVGASPVVETRVRIPTGDAVSRSYGARGPRGEDLLVVELQNDSKVPVALALAVQPHEGAGARIDSVSLAGSVLWLDGAPVVHLARSPGRFALSVAADARDAGEVVLAGDAEPVRAASVSCPDGQARGVLLFPLAHTASLRIAIVLDGAEQAVEPAELPSAQQVASGWATHSRGGARIEVPDRRLREAIAASTRFLLLSGRTGPLVARALGQVGFPARPQSASGVGGRAAGDPCGDVGTALAERADRWRLHRHALSDGEIEEVAAAIELWARRHDDEQLQDGLRALPAIAELFDAAGEHRAADDVRSIAGSGPEPPPAAPADLGDLLGSATPTWTWSGTDTGHDPTANARLLLAVRAHLVEELDDGLALSPVVPQAWLGQGWEVHGLPTAFGWLSFAIRWHGERPALLWDLEPHDGIGVVTLTAPSLDPTWSTAESSGEALLAAVPVPEPPHRRRGLTIPVTIEPLRRRP